MPWILVTLLITMSSASVPLRIDGRGGILVPVRVNGAGPFTFLLDTGATRSMVSDALARELGAPIVARSEIVTTAGSEMGMVVRLASVAVDNARVPDVLAPVFDDARLALLGRGVRGVLGQDFLAAFNYTLDYRRNRLTWEEGVACGARGAVTTAMIEGRPVIDVVNGRGEALRLVADTGADVVVLFNFNARGDPKGARLRVAGLAGAGASALATNIGELRAGLASLRDVSAVVVERADRDIDGLLPLHRFASVTFAAGGVCVVPRVSD